jgi:hypothetical protein
MLYYRQQGQSTWNILDISSAFGNFDINNDIFKPYIQLYSGDGGYTYQNGKGSFSIDYFKVYIGGASNYEYNDTICIGESYNNNGFSLPVQTVAGDIVYTLNLQTYQGCDSIISLHLTVKPSPVMDDIDNVSVCPATNQSIHFTGVDINLDSSVWTNSNTSIGLATSGTGDIAFTATNTGTIPLMSTITMLPKSDDGCIGNAKTFTVTVNPLPVMDDLDDISVCAGTNQNINFTGTNINLDSSVWTNSNTSIGLATNGTGNISFTATNTGTTPLTSTITIFPKSDDGCIGNTKTFTITINPLPVIDDVNDITLCAGTSQSINFTGTNINLDSSIWTNSNASIGLPTSGRGNIAFTATNAGTTLLTSTITIFPKSGNGCIGNAKTFTITVYPNLYIHITPNAFFFCEGDELKIETEASEKNISYQWYKDGIALTGAVSESYTVSIATKANSGVYHVEVSGACGEAKSSSVMIDVRDENLLVEKWHDVILVDNSFDEFCEYQWYRDGNIIHGAKEQFYQEIGGLKGCYSVDLTLVKGSTIRSCEHCVDNTQKDKKSISIYPNPVPSGTLIHILLHADADDYTINAALYTIEGKQVYKKQTEQDILEIETNSLSTGIYVLKLTTRNGQVYNEKIILY